MDFLAGCVGGCAAVVAGHPLDTLKVLIQTGRGSAMQCMRAMLSNGALASAYRGVGAPLAGVAGVNALVFGAYGNTRRLLPDSDSLHSHAIAGFTAGLIQSFACSPVELVKTRQQLAVSGDGIPKGAWAGARHLMRTGGVRGLYRGLGITMARDAPAFAIYFSTYEAMTRHSCSTWNVFMAGGVAGALSWIVLYPIDVVKSRIQGGSSSRSAWGEASHAFREEGWRWAVRGLGAVTVRAFIANGACFTAVVWTERAWNALSVPVLRHAADVVIHDTPERYYDI